MNTLYRAIYLREGLPRGVTYPAKDMVEALSFAENWEARTKLPVLTIRSLGESIHPKGKYDCVKTRWKKEGVWPMSLCINTNVRRNENG